jgi:ATP-dependent DNA helicase 2 subunit 1
VKGYVIFKRQEIHKTSYIWLGGEKPLTAKGVSSKLADDSGKPVDKDYIRRAYKFGGEQIAFSPDELAKLRHFGDPVIRILAFKTYSSVTLPAWANVGRSTFIYPSEEGYVGSSRVFSALHASMLEKHKMAFVWFISRKNASPTLAAMVAGKEERDDETGEQEVPAGMWLIPLPFVDDIRDVPKTQVVPASDDLVDKMRIVVQQLQLPKAKYFPSKYPNPSLQWHYRILQAMALDEELPEKPEDKTAPRIKQIHKRAGEYVLAWGEQLEQDHENWAKSNAHTTSLPKHGRPKVEGDGDGPPAKKIKKEEGTGVSEEEMRKAWKENRAQRFTVNQLKTFAASKGISEKGKKAEIVDAIEGWFESQ